MNQSGGIFLITGVCAIVLFILFFKNKAALLSTLVLRAILGIFLIYCINYTLLCFGFDIQVGFNAVSVLTSAVFGIPGVLLLFGICFL